MSDSGEQPLRMALHERHAAAGAVMAIEDGWEVPLHYGDPEAEYDRALRQAGVLDVSDVGRIRIRGDGALEMLEHLCTADVARQEDDTATYTLLCNEAGRILDHGLIVRLEGYWMLTCSPSRRTAVLEHLQAHAEQFGARVDDQTLKTSMLAVVGPGAPAILDAVLPLRVSGLPRGSAKVGSMLIARYLAMRTGPTRLWSLEVMLPNMLVGRAWDFITNKAGGNCIVPVGRAVRERLRVEAGLPRWGQEIDEAATPLSAGLTGAVDLIRDFLGAEALRELAGP